MKKASTEQWNSLLKATNPVMRGLRLNSKAICPHSLQSYAWSCTAQVTQIGSMKDWNTESKCTKKEKVTTLPKIETGEHTACFMPLYKNQLCKKTSLLTKKPADRNSPLVLASIVLNEMQGIRTAQSMDFWENKPKLWSWVYQLRTLKEADME